MTIAHLQHRQVGAQSFVQTHVNEDAIAYRVDGIYDLMAASMGRERPNVLQTVGYENTCDSTKNYVPRSLYHGR